MKEQNNTRATLLIRLRDQADEESWAEFVEIYTPLLHAYCQKREINFNETSDIVQEVFRSIMLAMKGFEYDPAKGAFRAWLFTVLRNAIRTHFRKAGRAPLTTRETALIEKIEASDDGVGEIDWNRDYQLRLLNWAMEKIKPTFSEQVWTVFTEIVVHEREPTEVAAELGMTGNAVAVTKYRVMQRLRQVIQDVDTDRWELEMAVKSQKS